MKKHDYLFKYIIIGDSGVGKTAILNRFTMDVFNSSFVSTIGIDFKTSLIEIDDKVIKLQIWDTAGQERFRTITTAYYRGSRGVILVYDVTSQVSFDNVERWIGNIDTHAGDNNRRIIVANKCDLPRVVTRAQGEALAQRHGCLYVETSASNGTGISECFDQLTRAIYNDINGNGVSAPTPTTIQLKAPTPQKHKKCC